MVLFTKENELNLKGFSDGMYYLRCENQVMKVIIE